MWIYIFPPSVMSIPIKGGGSITIRVWCTDHRSIGIAPVVTSISASRGADQLSRGSKRTSLLFTSRVSEPKVTIRLFGSEGWVAANLANRVEVPNLT